MTETQIANQFLQLKEKLKQECIYWCGLSHTHRRTKIIDDLIDLELLVHYVVVCLLDDDSQNKLSQLIENKLFYNRQELLSRFVLRDNSQDSKEHNRILKEEFEHCCDQLDEYVLVKAKDL
jgi:hypothetical protein